MDVQDNNIKVYSTKSYYSTLLLYSIIILLGLIVIQFLRPSTFYINLSLFLLLELFLLIQKQVSFIEIRDNVISLEYFQYFKKNMISSILTKASITKDFEISYRSPSKKVRLNIIINKKNFKLTKLDAFDENDLIAIYTRSQSS